MLETVKRSSLTSSKEKRAMKLPMSLDLVEIMCRVANMLQIDADIDGGGGIEGAVVLPGRKVKRQKMTLMMGTVVKEVEVEMIAAGHQ